MAWIALTSSALKELMAGPEFSSVTAAARNTGQTADALVDNALARIVKEARGYIGRKYNLGPEGTIPDELEDACLDRARLRVLTRLAGLKSLVTKERTQAASDALSLFKSVARGEFAIVESDAPADLQPAVSTIAVISKRPPRFTKSNLDRVL